jgi:hypothetical protein
MITYEARENRGVRPNFFVSRSDAACSATQQTILPFWYVRFASIVMPLHQIIMHSLTAYT